MLIVCIIRDHAQSVNQGGSRKVEKEGVGVLSLTVQQDGDSKWRLMFTFTVMVI